jgi:hypothetical protein
VDNINDYPELKSDIEKCKHAENILKRAEGKEDVFI